jgi:hypothetical protein
MKRKLLFIMAALLLGVGTMAQQNLKLRFGSFNNVGLLQGGSDQNLQLQTINGMHYKTFFGGIGIGLDNYHFKSVPLFIDLRKNLQTKAQTPFVYADFGAAFPWDRRMGDEWSKSTFKTGFLYDLGLGYTIPVKGRFAINIAAGYSQKFVEEMQENDYRMWWDFPPYGPIETKKDTSHYNYTFRRFSFKIGFSF